MNKISAIRGMNDVSPDESPYWQRVEMAARDVLAAYGYREIRPPVVERTELFRRSVGEGTDIVDKEMYTFEDRNGESLTLRPECTASCVRAAIEHSWIREGGRRVWHIGPMFRYEKPQSGRYRQFHQLDVEALGFAGPDVDAELIAIGRRLFAELEIGPLRLELNCLGSRDAQARFRERLMRFFESNRDALDEDSLRRLGKNPLRILDSKNPEMNALLSEAPAPVDHLDEASAAHFDGLKAMLEAAGIEYAVNRRLVRGLDYYTGTVFEWTTDALGAQNAVCGGGRYDRLFSEIGGADAPAIGFAMGLERIVALLAAGRPEAPARSVHAYLLAVGDAAQAAALALGERLRDAGPGLSVIVDAGGGGFKPKFKRANRSGARFAVVLGQDEVDGGTLSIKDLRTDADQRTMPQAEAAAFLAAQAGG